MVLLYLYSISLFRALGNSFRATYRLSGKLNYPNGIVCGEDKRYSRVSETGEILVHMSVYDALDLRERIDQLCDLARYLIRSALSDPFFILTFIAGVGRTDETADASLFLGKGKKLSAGDGLVVKEYHGEALFRFTQEKFNVVGMKLKVAVVEDNEIDTAYHAGVHSDVVFVERLNLAVASQLIFLVLGLLTEIVAEIVVSRGV